ncbi:MAG: hypothetical protein U0354_11150 [Candidatus Sericytochromatia bacterium]
MENNIDNFFENFFYYKRNIRDFFLAFNNCTENEQEQITQFLLGLYPLSDKFLMEILKDKKYSLGSEISIDTINYINNQFYDEFKGLNIDFDSKIDKSLDMIQSIQSVIEINQAKFNRISKLKKEVIELKEKDDKLSKDIKDLENTNIDNLKDDIINKQKKLDELRQEKSEMSRHLDKVKNDINELAKHSDLKDRLTKCRDIIQDLNLPRDYSDRQIHN